MKNYKVIAADEEIMKNASDTFFRQFVEWMNSESIDFSRWVEVNENLPDSGVNVQVKLNDGNIFQGFVIDGEWYLGHKELMYEQIWGVVTDNEEDLEVVAWREIEL